jgi:hypothetical protein
MKKEEEHNEEITEPLFEESPIQQINESLTFISIGTQVTSGNFIIKYSDLISDDKELNKMTGISNFQIYAIFIDDNIVIMYNSSNCIVIVIKLSSKDEYTIKSVFTRAFCSIYFTIFLKSKFNFMWFFF